MKHSVRELRCRIRLGLQQLLRAADIPLVRGEVQRRGAQIHGAPGRGLVAEGLADQEHPDAGLVLAQHCLAEGRPPVPHRLVDGRARAQQRRDVATLALVAGGVERADPGEVSYVGTNSYQSLVCQNRQNSQTQQKLNFTQLLLGGVKTKSCQN